jgi:hypothetical protein
MVNIAQNVNNNNNLNPNRVFGKKCIFIDLNIRYFSAKYWILFCFM